MGLGWRFVFDQTRSFHPLLIGGSQWATELSLPEAKQLSLGVVQLVDQHKSISTSLLPEETITLEFESSFNQGKSTIWICLEGTFSSWCLRFILTPSSENRAFEASWDQNASMAIALVLEDFLREYN